MYRRIEAVKSTEKKKVDQYRSTEPSTDIFYRKSRYYRLRFGSVVPSDPYSFLKTYVSRGSACMKIFSFIQLTMMVSNADLRINPIAFL